MKGILYKRGVNGCSVRIFGFHTPMHKRFETACAVHDGGVLVIADRQVVNPTHEQLIAAGGKCITSRCQLKRKDLG